jgi:hypothetical protein
MFYFIKVQGELDATWSEWFDQLCVTHTADGETILRGILIDQAALYGVLTRLRDLGLPLLTVHGQMAGAGPAEPVCRWQAPIVGPDPAASEGQGEVWECCGGNESGDGDQHLQQ